VTEAQTAVTPRRVAAVGREPTWYKDAVIYELHVRSFADGNDDGQGDFVGLTGRLDYLQELGVSAVWLLPFYPSPLRDDGYDISDYTDVHPIYGNLEAFRTFLGAAHDRGIRVITELVLNHTSDQHPWFQRARRAAPDSPERGFYLWSDTPNRFQGVRVIFRDSETSNWSWDPRALAYYYHRFYFHQPDLNYDNPDVVAAMFRVMDFWLELGVDGLRLDAVPYLFKREGTSCENLPETHAFLRQLRAHIDERFTDRMLLAEANQWPEDAALYMGSGRGDECHTAFHFPLMPRLFMATRMESRFPIVDILEQTPPIPPDAQWVLFLRNHDELTLEMVSDEERDYMYRMYATDPHARLNLGIRRRLAPLLSNDRRLIELMTGLLLSLPGTPVIYYGDEIGMGDNIYLGDRNGVRSPMQWTADRNAGFSPCNPQRLYLPVIVDPEYHYQTVNVETQHANHRSLLWYTRRRIALRKQHPTFGHGSFAMLFPENPRIFAFLRHNGTDDLLVVANLSHLPQMVDLDLSPYRGACPVELSGPTDFSVIGAEPYRLSLAPYGFFWFRLERRDAGGINAVGASVPVAPTLSVPPDWATLHLRGVRPRVEAAFYRYVVRQRWFHGRGDRPTDASWEEDVPLGPEPSAPHLAVVDVAFAIGETQRYLLPLGIVGVSDVAKVRERAPATAVATLDSGDPHDDVPMLQDAGQEPEFVRSVLDRIARGSRETVGQFELIGGHTDAFDATTYAEDRELPIEPIRREQSNSSVRVGDRYIFKLYRGIGEGINPELEIGLFLTRSGRFAPIAPVAGYLEGRPRRGVPETLAILHRFVPNEGDAWEMTLQVLRRYFERVHAAFAAGKVPSADRPGREALGRTEPSPEATDLISLYLPQARRLGTITSELHRTLADDSGDPAFSPEPFDPFYARSIYQTMQSNRRHTFDLLRRSRPALEGEVRARADRVLELEARADARYRSLLNHQARGMRIRIHGDLHLGQLLWTGKDFVVIDFEGEPSRPVSERRIKRSPLRDVAGMLRSFEYAALSALKQQPAAQAELPERRRQLADAAAYWVAWVSSEYLRVYRSGIAGDPELVPHDGEGFDRLLDAYILEKAVYELGYELNSRPDWVDLPLRGIETLLAGGPDA
jgi:maltose alpha-D-glucosyltransferase / alpha-amylase